MLGRSAWGAGHGWRTSVPARSAQVTEPVIRAIIVIRGNWWYYWVRGFLSSSMGPEVAIAIPRAGQFWEWLFCGNTLQFWRYCSQGIQKWSSLLLGNIKGLLGRSQGHHVCFRLAMWGHFSCRGAGSGGRPPSTPRCACAELTREQPPRVCCSVLPMQGLQFLHTAGWQLETSPEDLPGCFWIIL